MSESALGLHATRYDRIIKLIQRQLGDRISFPFELQLRGGRSYHFGSGEPVISFVVNDRNGLAALCSFDELKFCEAYMSGCLEISGDMFKLASFRSILSDRHPLQYLLNRLLPIFIGQVQTNQKAIARHYEHDKDFFLAFMDSTRCYSQALFERDDEALETAQRRKLDFALGACRMKAGSDLSGGEILHF